MNSIDTQHLSTNPLPLQHSRTDTEPLIPSQITNPNPMLVHFGRMISNLHTLLGIEDQPALFSHPKLGASWEGFALEQLLSQADARNAYFWATQSRAELDLLLHAGGKRWGFEFKCQDAPVMTASLHTALENVKLDRAWIVYPGAQAYPVHEKVDVIPLEQAMDTIRKIS